MTETAITLKAIKQVAKIMQALENLNCLTLEVFSGMITNVVCRLAKLFTSIRSVRFSLFKRYNLLVTDYIISHNDL